MPEWTLAPGPQLFTSRFGRTRDGDAVTCWVLSAGGLVVRALDFGATITSIRSADRHGVWDDVTLGHETLAAYEDDPFHLGAMVGRVAGRIRDARFTLDGTEHRLAANAGAAHLHGGVRGFGRRMWHGESVRGDGVVGVTFTRTSPDGEEGYPGTLDVRVTYTVHESGVLAVEWEAGTDRATPVNLTQHVYLNLSGGRGDVGEHVLQVHADRRLVLDADLLPTGEIAPVEGTPFDFRVPRVIGERIDADHPQLRAARGYDLTYLVPADGALRPVARVVSPASGRTLDVLTTEPALQLYTGNFLDAPPATHAAHARARHAALCLETQHCPDAVHHPHFPSVILRPGEVRRSRTEFRFGVEHDA